MRNNSNRSKFPEVSGNELQRIERGQKADTLLECAADYYEFLDGFRMAFVPFIY